MQWDLAAVGMCSYYSTSPLLTFPAVTTEYYDSYDSPPR